MKALATRCLPALLLLSSASYAQEQLTAGRQSFRGTPHAKGLIPGGKRWNASTEDSTRIGLYVLDSLRFARDAQDRLARNAQGQKISLSFTDRLTRRAILSAKLRGRVSKVSGDTVFFTLFPIKQIPDAASVFNKPRVVNDRDNGQSFIYIIPKKQQRLLIPYHNWSLATTAIPLRIGLGQQGETQSSFLNANVAVFRVWGTSVIRAHSPGAKLRNRYLGVGPFVGPTRTTGTVNGKEVGRLGAIYGLNAIVGLGGLNFIVAGGRESDRSRVTTNFSPWVGFGIGIKLVDIGSGMPGNEQK